MMPTMQPASVNQSDQPRKGIRPGTKRTAQTSPMRTERNCIMMGGLSGLKVGMRKVNCDRRTGCELRPDSS